MGGSERKELKRHLFHAWPWRPLFWTGPTSGAVPACQGNRHPQNLRSHGTTTLAGFPTSSASIVFDGDEGRLSEAAFLRDFAGDLPEANGEGPVRCRNRSTRLCSPARSRRPPGARSRVSMLAQPRRSSLAAAWSSRTRLRRSKSSSIALASSAVALPEPAKQAEIVEMDSRVETAKSRWKRPARIKELSG